MYYVYLLRSLKNRQYYIGSTNDLKKRLYLHNRGLNQATKAYIPWQHVYYEAYPTSHAAREREQVLNSHGRTLAALKQRVKTGRSI